jgi:hypothetical protein
MATSQTSPQTARFIATIAASGAAIGVVLMAARSGHPASACTAAARHAGACVPASLASAKALVTAGLVGLLLGGVIAIATVLTWREARSVRDQLGRRPSPRPRAAAASHRRGFAVAHRARH